MIHPLMGSRGQLIISSQAMALTQKLATSMQYSGLQREAGQEQQQCSRDRQRQHESLVPAAPGSEPQPVSHTTRHSAVEQQQRLQRSQSIGGCTRPELQLL